MTNTDDARWFDCRPAKIETCHRCHGCGKVDVGYALRPSGVSVKDAPDGAISAFVVGSFDVFQAAREARDVARTANRPVAFECLDHTVVVRPGDDPDQVACAWWLRQYGETPEATWSRR